MDKARILVVDDLTDWRATLSGMLTDEGFAVSTASNRQEALEVLSTNRLHVVIVDVRLDESDANNRDGLTLMHEIHLIDPTIVVVVLTGYATVSMVQEALQPTPEGPAPAFMFLEKTNANQIVTAVQRAIEEFIRVDHDLLIVGKENILTPLPKKIRFTGSVKPAHHRVIEEAEELLRKLFFGYEKIEILPIQRGYSGSAVFTVIPWYKSRGRGEALIIKVGECSVIESEVDNHTKLAQGLVGGHRIPKTLDIRRTSLLAGVVYTFAGLGQVQDFASFYRTHQISEVQLAIENLFVKTCFPWQSTSSFVQDAALPRRIFLPLLRLSEDNLRIRLDKMMGGKHPFQQGRDGTYLLLGNDHRLHNPVEFALSTPIMMDTLISTIHGDLNGYNVLIDDHNDCWLIDFANTQKGPLLHDYATFESFIHTNLIGNLDWHILLEWETLVLLSPDLTDVFLPAPLAAITDIAKAHQAILDVRRLAFLRRKGQTEITYILSLLFNSLKIMTVMDLDGPQRDRALIVASLAAQRLTKEMP